MYFNTIQASTSGPAPQYFGLSILESSQAR